VHRQYNEDLFESSKMTFGEHLDELRVSLVKAMLAFLIGFLIALMFSGPVVEYVQTPLRNALKDYYIGISKKQFLNYLNEQRAKGMPVPTDLEAAAEDFARSGLVQEERYLDPADLADILSRIAPNAVDKTKFPARDGHIATLDNLVRIPIYHSIEKDSRVRVVGFRMEESFVVYMKTAFVVGTIIASPFVFYFIWQFVAAGLYPHEQRYVHIFLPFSIALFLAGAALAFFVVFKFVLAFLLSFYDWMDIDPDARISDWLTFVLVLPLGFGIAFQLPLVMLFLERIGILNARAYLSHWKISVLTIAFLSMVLTPSDPYSMMLMMTPLVGLYFFGIMLCKWMPRRATPFGEAIE
jgi:sec-independent protein translocase protein TatC